MRVIKEIPEDLVWIDWLKSEYKERLPKKHQQQTEKLVTQPNLQDKTQNQQRKQLLYKIRWHLLETIPPKTTWYKVKLTKTDFQNLYILGYWTFNLLSEYTRKLETITKNLQSDNHFIPEKIRDRIRTIEFEHHRNKVNGILKEKQSLDDYQPVLLARSLSSTPTLIEGCHRAMATYISCFTTMKREYSPVQAFIGIVGEEKCPSLAPETKRGRELREVQTEYYYDSKGIEIAKHIIKLKILNLNQFLDTKKLPVLDSCFIEKVNLVETSDPSPARGLLREIDKQFTDIYLDQVINLIPKRFRPDSSSELRVFMGRNNPFEFAYGALHTHVFNALMRAELEPYLGFLFPPKHWRYFSFSLSEDFCEIFRCIVDYFTVDYLVDLNGTVFSDGVKLDYASDRKYLDDVVFEVFKRDLMVFLGDRDNPFSVDSLDTNLGVFLKGQVDLFAEFLLRKKQDWGSEQWVF